MAILPNQLYTIELGRVRWREVINNNFVILDEFLGTFLSREGITTDTTNFNKNLSVSDDTVQKRLQTINDLDISSTRAETSTDTTNFDNNLSSADDTVQKRLETLDNLQLVRNREDIPLDTTNFNNNLDNTIDTVQKLADWLDNLDLSRLTPSELLGGDSSTTTFDYVAEGGDSSTTTFDNTFDGGTSL